MTPLLLALVLAQAMPTGSPAASVNPAPVSSTIPDSGRPASTAEDAVIGNSGSTNAAGYTIVVRRDGSAEIDQAGRVTQGTVPRAQTAWLFAKLQNDGPLANMVSGHCMRSMSFGSTTRLTYRGETTGDLGCTADPNARELKRTVDVIVGQLGVALQPRRAILHMRSL